MSCPESLKKPRNVTIYKLDRLSTQEQLAKLKNSSRLQNPFLEINNGYKVYTLAYLNKLTKELANKPRTPIVYNSLDRLARTKKACIARLNQLISRLGDKRLISFTIDPFIKDANPHRYPLGSLLALVKSGYFDAIFKDFSSIYKTVKSDNLDMVLVGLLRANKCSYRTLSSKLRISTTTAKKLNDASLLSTRGHTRARQTTKRAIATRQEVLAMHRSGYTTIEIANKQTKIKLRQIQNIIKDYYDELQKAVELYETSSRRSILKMTTQFNVMKEIITTNCNPRVDYLKAYIRLTSPP